MDISYGIYAVTQIKKKNCISDVSAIEINRSSSGF